MSKRSDFSRQSFTDRSQLLPRVRTVQTNNPRFDRDPRQVTKFRDGRQWRHSGDVGLDAFSRRSDDRHHSSWRVGGGATVDNKARWERPGTAGRARP
jgi:hypothetical protein